MFLLVILLGKWSSNVNALSEARFQGEKVCTSTVLPHSSDVKMLVKSAKVEGRIWRQRLGHKCLYCFSSGPRRDIAARRGLLSAYTIVNQPRFNKLTPY